MLSTLKKATTQALEEIKEEKAVRLTDEVFLLFAMGSQFDHLIKQVMDKLGVFCLVADPASVTVADVKAIQPIGIILSGGSASAHIQPPPFDKGIFDLKIPILGICLGFQLWIKHLGGKIESSEKKEFGIHDLEISRPSLLFSGIPRKIKVLESHGDRVITSSSSMILASTSNAQITAANNSHLWGVQFHPEVSDTEYGDHLFRNFCFSICNASSQYPVTQVATRKIKQLRQTIGDQKVILALSGGSDSSVVAHLLKHALKDKQKLIRAVYIRGIDRPDDEKFVLKFFANQDWIELIVVDETQQFLSALDGITAMKEKRIAMRGVHKRALEDEAKKFGAKFIVQGTLYTDISESGGGYDSGAKKAQIKLHHNVNLGFSLDELTPLDDCVKDSARNIGRKIGVPEELLLRHPFPGPGLVVRIEGPITTENLRICRQADNIYIEELRNWKLYETVWQAGAVVTQSITTCTKGDDATSGVVLALWAVWSVNGFTAQPVEFPFDFLVYVSQRLTNEIPEIGNVVYRISGKPPATIEWG